MQWTAQDSRGLFPVLWDLKIMNDFLNLPAPISIIIIISMYYYSIIISIIINY